MPILASVPVLLRAWPRRFVTLEGGYLRVREDETPALLANDGGHTGGSPA